MPRRAKGQPGFLTRGVTARLCRWRALGLGHRLWGDAGGGAAPREGGRGHGHMASAVSSEHLAAPCTAWTQPRDTLPREGRGRARAEPTPRGLGSNGVKRISVPGLAGDRAQGSRQPRSRRSPLSAGSSGGSPPRLGATSQGGCLHPRRDGGQQGCGCNTPFLGVSLSCPPLARPAKLPRASPTPTTTAERANRPLHGQPRSDTRVQPWPVCVEAGEKSRRLRRTIPLPCPPPDTGPASQRPRVLPAPSPGEGSLAAPCWPRDHQHRGCAHQHHPASASPWTARSPGGTSTQGRGDKQLFQAVPGQGQPCVAGNVTAAGRAGAQRGEGTAGQEAGEISAST